MQVEIKKLPKSEIEIEGEIPFSDLEIHREKAIQDLSSDLEVQGFRKGHIPEKIVLEKIGEPELLNKMAEQALGNAYPKIIIDNKIDPIAQPQITITKIAMNNPLGFKIKVPVMPEMKLPDYKNIAKDVVSKKEEIKVEKEDTQKIINQVLESRQRQPQINADEKQARIDADNIDGQLGSSTPKSEEKPELTDELVKTLGDFKDLKDFHQKVEAGVKKEKEIRAKEKVRLQIMEGIINETKIDLPDVVVKSELDKMIVGFKGDIERMGLKVDKYLKNINKSVDDLRVEWRGEAEKRAKSQLILNKIAIEEKIYPKKNNVEKEAEHLMSHYKNTDPNRIKIYVETILTNEAVMHWLENGGEEQDNETIDERRK